MMASFGKNGKDLVKYLKNKKCLVNGDSGLKNWKTALNRVKNGSNEVLNVQMIGDSITEGRNSSDQNTTNLLSYFSKTRTYFKEQYGDVGTGFIPMYYPSSPNTALWTFTGTWDFTVHSYGLFYYSAVSISAGNTASLEFSGTGFILQYVKKSGWGTHSISIDGGTPVVFDAGAPTTNAVQLVITGLDEGNHTATVTSGATGLVLVGGCGTRGTRGVRFNMIAKSGSVAGDLGAWAQFLDNGIKVWNPTLSIVSFIANDYGAQTSLSTYKTQLLNIVNEAKKYGDVLITSIGARSEVKTIPQSDYDKICFDVAVETNSAFLDVFKAWKGWDPSYAHTTRGFFDVGEPVHPNDLGHDNIFELLKQVLI